MRAVIGLGRWMLHWAVEAVSPVVGGCAGFVVGQVAGPHAGGYAGRGVKCALDYFGKRIADGWIDRLKDKSPAERQAAVEELAALPPDEARREVAEAVERLAPEASTQDKALVIDYLASIPQTVARSLVRDRGTGKATMPAGVMLDDPRTFLHMLPVDAPPYPAPCELPGTPYRLEELVGVGGFGAVYRAVDPKLPYLALAIKFCLDPTMASALKQERGNLERLIRAGGEVWSSRVVRLYGYDLEHRTPYLVYEFVPGGDLARHVAEAVAAGDKPKSEQIRHWVEGVAEGLSFAHRHGLVHRDLKPANVLLGPEPGRQLSLKIADFGIGGPAAAQAIQFSRIGTLSANQLSLAEQASLLRGAGTPLYMSPEQRRGEAPDPRHDVYSLGVMWYQLLLGDCGRELHAGWADELLEEANAPADQVELIRQCVGMLKKRPADAGELLNRLRGTPASTPAAAPSPPPPIPETKPPSNELMRQVGEVRRIHQQIEVHAQPTIGTRFATAGIAFAVFLGVMAAAGMFLMTITGGGRKNDDVMVLMFPATFGAAYAAFVMSKRYMKNAARLQALPYGRKLQIAVDLLATAFPDHVRSWGGREVLFDSLEVEKIYRRLEWEAGARS